MKLPAGSTPQACKRKAKDIGVLWADRKHMICNYTSMLTNTMFRVEMRIEGESALIFRPSRRKIVVNVPNQSYIHGIPV